MAWPLIDDPPPITLPCATWIAPCTQTCCARTPGIARLEVSEIVGRQRSAD
jgi:hypothetical protein